VLGGVALEGGRLDLAGREASVSRLALVNGRIEAERDAQGRIPLAEAFRPAADPTPGPVPAAVPADGEARPWKYRLDQLDLSGFEIAARDLGVTPAAGLTLQHVEASLSGLSQDLGASLPVRLAFRVREGGRFEAAGQVVPATRRADLKVGLSKLALSPVQPYLSRDTNLALVKGSLSSAGRVRHDQKQSRYQGDFHLDDLLINEASTGDRLLAWKSVSTRQLDASGQGLEIGELRVDRPGMKMVIYQDKSTSLGKALRKAPPAPSAEDADARAAPERVADPATPPETAAPTESAAPEQAASKPAAFPIDIERVRVSGGEMDFADLSLQLPFGTRIHTLKGNSATMGFTKFSHLAHDLEDVLIRPVSSVGNTTNRMISTSHTHLKRVYPEWKGLCRNVTSVLTWPGKANYPIVFPRVRWVLSILAISMKTS